MYQYMGIQYNSPFIGLFLFAPDYIRLLQNIEIMQQPLRFIDKSQSKYKNTISDDNYVIGVLPMDIEIHFLHYSSAETARSSWERRLKRLDMNNLIVKFCDRDLCTYDLIKQFDSLPYRNKVCFTVKQYPEFSSTIQIRDQTKKWVERERLGVDFLESEEEVFYI